MKVLKFATAIALFLGFPSLASAQDAPRDEPVEVMVLGLYHFANPGRDVVNVEVDDVLAPRRQKEIQILVDTLAQWRPTRVAVESMADLPSLEVSDYDQTTELLKTTRNESVQIGYRLAQQLGHPAVYGYDEQAGEGEPDYFPFGKVQAFAAENGQMDMLNSLFAGLKAQAAEDEAELPNQTIAESLLSSNDEAEVSAQHDLLYYSLLSIGDGDAQPGAELNAMWYLRNAKMFAKIDMFAEPGDRVLVLAGSGHATWLKHFTRRMPGYELVDAQPYVRAAAIASDVVAAD